MNNDFLKCFYRSIDVAKFIIEDDGHTIVEAAKEFKCSRQTIDRALKTLGIIAFYDDYNIWLYSDIEKEDLQKLYKKAKNKLKDLAVAHCANNIAKYNEARKKASKKSIS